MALLKDKVQNESIIIHSSQYIYSPTIYQEVFDLIFFFFECFNASL